MRIATRTLATRTTLAALAVGAALGLSACTGSNAVSTTPDNNNSAFRFASATSAGSVYPPAERKRAENVSGALLDGGKMTLSSSKGKVVVLNFWASWCGPCKTETPQFDLLYRKIHSKGVDFFGIDNRDDRGNAQAFVKNNDISFPIVYDQQGRTALQLGDIPAAGLPFTVLIDKSGRVAGVYVERLSPVDLTNSIDKLLAER